MNGTALESECCSMPVCMSIVRISQKPSYRSPSGRRSCDANRLLLKQILNTNSPM
jgi:hypothetical protein